MVLAVVRKWQRIAIPRCGRSSVSIMKPIIAEFVGGPLNENTLRTDSGDREEVWLANAYYEMSHHGTIGGKCVGLSCDAEDFARRHGGVAAKELSLCQGYVVTERRETEVEIFVTFKSYPIQDISSSLIPME